MSSNSPRDSILLLLLGAGELGRETALAARALGASVVAVDRYEGAPAMQVAGSAEVLASLEGPALEDVIRSHAPDFIIPEIEAVDAELLGRLEADGFTAVVPSAEAVRLTSNRAAIRDLAARELGIRTPRYALAGSPDELRAACDHLGFPCVVKSLRSWSGAGQSVVQGLARVERAWAYAQEEGAGANGEVLAEEFIDFHTEITLLTIRDSEGDVHFLEPIGHRQERGTYRESWIPQPLSEAHLEEAREIAARLVRRLGGVGVFGVEFFVTDQELVFSEVSARPHDTGFVTLLAHDASQFELHVRALMGLPLPEQRCDRPSASAVILARDEGSVAGYEGVERAEKIESVQVRLFGKPSAHPFRRMGVTLATGDSVEEARARALEAAARIEVMVD